jgi:hypothetical protein
MLPDTAINHQTHSPRTEQESEESAPSCCQALSWRHDVNREEEKPPLLLFLFLQQPLYSLKSNILFQGLWAAGGAGRD